MEKLCCTIVGIKDVNALVICADKLSKNKCFMAAASSSVIRMQSTVILPAHRTWTFYTSCSKCALGDWDWKLVHTFCGTKRLPVSSSVTVWTLDPWVLESFVHFLMTLDWRLFILTKAFSISTLIKGFTVVRRWALVLTSSSCPTKKAQKCWEVFMFKCLHYKVVMKIVTSIYWYYNRFIEPL